MLNSALDGSKLYVPAALPKREKTRYLLGGGIDPKAASKQQENNLTSTPPPNETKTQLSSTIMTASLTSMNTTW
jgi:hypothetical protein